jgi:hypothetical protein
MRASIGRIVIYTISEGDVFRIRHIDKKRDVFDCGKVPSIGAKFPMIVTSVHEDEKEECIGGVVFHESNDVLRVVHAPFGTGPGRWSWPTITHPSADAS